MSKKILRLNATALSQCGSCVLKLWLTIHEGYKPRPLDVAMEYGSAFHIFKEQLRRLRDVELAKVYAQKYFESKKPFMHIPKTKLWQNGAHLEMTCLAYVEEFGIDGEKDTFKTLRNVKGELLLERTFNYPIFENDAYIVMFSGTIDELGSWIDKEGYGIGDEKTTTTYDPGEYFSSYSLSPQLMFYLNAVQWHGKNFPDSIYGTMVKAGRIGCFINGVFLSVSKPTMFARSPIMYFSDRQMAEFRLGVDKIIQGLLDEGNYYHNGNIRRPYKQGMSNGSCLGNYGKKCPFFPACNAPDDESMFAILKNNYNQVEYNPLEFRKLV